MRWTIRTDGTTTDVAGVTKEFEKTYLASCLAGVIKTMTFPRHRVQGPITEFPFRFGEAPKRGKAVEPSGQLEDQAPR